MKASTAIGIGVAFAGLAVGALMEGASPTAFLNVPALLIVIGGTFGATFAGTTIEKIKLIPSLYKKAMGGEKPDMAAQLELLVGFAERARREGLLALDEEVAELEDEFTRKGLQLVVDGTDPELVREILENEIDGMIGRHQAAVSPFEKAGGFAPTMGIIGTVMGLVHVLENLDAPATLGPAISGAFIATLYGVGSANVVFLPTANKLKSMSAEEIELRSMTLEGILSIQAGDNPRVVADKLLSFIPPAERAGDAEPAAVPEDMAPAEAEFAAA
ncbi:MAG: chemotaxis protein MotA [Thermoleophilaceae bacterium]|jgi:chemotaxis protein MotA|nr:chemotaxis protein MotA [Pseudonocardiales bacterium]MEA2431280.1 chemotaxis protein MotA [Thermoleophilaceae bacterium]